MRLHRQIYFQLNITKGRAKVKIKQLYVKDYNNQLILHNHESTASLSGEGHSFHTKFILLEGEDSEKIRLTVLISPSSTKEMLTDSSTA